MRFTPFRALLAGSLATLSLALPAHADENLWGYVYGSDTLPKGASEIYLWATDRRDKGQGHYDAQDYKLEVEHGFTDKFQASLYLNGTAHDIKGAAPLEDDGTPEYPDRNNFNFQGVQASFKYNFLSSYKDGIGVSAYIEPGYARYDKISGEREDQYSLEMKLILQKNFLDDTLLWATNFTLEPERSHNKASNDWENELEFEVTSGLSYRIAPKWFAGIEGRYHSEYPNFTHQFDREHYAIFFGPNIHYGGEKVWWTLTYLPQVIGAPTDDDRSSSLHLDEHERRELRFKIGYNF